MWRDKWRCGLPLKETIAHRRRESRGTGRKIGQTGRRTREGEGRGRGRGGGGSINATNHLSLEISSMSGSVSPGGRPIRSLLMRHASFLISSIASKFLLSLASSASLYCGPETTENQFPQSSSSPCPPALACAPGRSQRVPGSCHGATVTRTGRCPASCHPTLDTSDQRASSVYDRACVAVTVTD